MEPLEASARETVPMPGAPRAAGGPDARKEEAGRSER